MFTRSIPLFRLFGFSVRMDASWLLLAVLITWSLAAGYFPSLYPGLAPSTYWWMGVVGLIGLGMSIVLHELAHSLVARRFDMPIKGITLFIFGGVAEMQDEPTSPKGEFLMAAAGPIMSFLLAAAFYLLTIAVAGTGGPMPLQAVLNYLALINILLAVFNLVPAFPLDGGRMLRAALWGWKGDNLWATRIAAGFGSAFGIFLIVLGLLNVVTGNFIGGLWWFLIGLFVRGASSMTLNQTVARNVFAGRPVRDFMRHDPITVTPDLTVESLVQDYIYRYYFKSLPVTQGGRLVGHVTVDDVKAADRSRWSALSVGDIMRPCDDENTIDPDADAGKALAKMRRGGLSRLIVSRGGRIVGIVSLKDMLGYLSLALDLGPDQDGNSTRMTPPPDPRLSHG